MGAKCWTYWAPYQQPISRALESVREKVFREDRYRKVWDVEKDHPTTIEQVIQLSAELGTRSILDITRIAPAPAFGAACPLSERQLLALFGTTRPTRASIEAHEHTLWKVCDRWDAVYVVAHDDAGAPESIAFIGVTGD